MYTPSIYKENLFDDFFGGFPFFDDRAFKDIEKKLYGHKADRIMSTDIKEFDGAYEMEIDLPGFNKEDIRLTLDNGYLTVNAAKGFEKDENKENGKSIRKERYSGTCSRSFYVGNHLKEEDIKAEFRNGVLKLNILKVDPATRVEQEKLIAIEG